MGLVRAMGKISIALCVLGLMADGGAAKIMFQGEDAALYFRDAKFTLSNTSFDTDGVFRVFGFVRSLRARARDPRYLPLLLFSLTPPAAPLCAAFPLRLSLSSLFLATMVMFCLCGALGCPELQWLSAACSMARLRTAATAPLRRGTASLARLPTCRR